MCRGMELSRVDSKSLQSSSDVEVPVTQSLFFLLKSPSTFGGLFQLDIISKKLIFMLVFLHIAVRGAINVTKNKLCVV